MDGKNGVEIVIIIGTAGMLLLTLLVIGFILIYQRKMFNKQQELILIEIKNQKKLVKAEIQIKEREHKRVAQELHDEIGASLTAIRFQFENIKEPENIKTELKASLKDITQKIRRISNDLLPSVLEEFGLSDAINDFVGHFNQNQIIDIYLDKKNYSVKSLKKDIELSLYRVVQELTNNIIKYAEATEIKMILSNTNEHVVITIIDDGNGIIPTANKSRKTLGLKNIESRIQYVNGTISREPHQLKGTVVTITAPLK